MLSSILNSQQAIQVNIQIIRVFAQLREMLQTQKNLVHWMENMEQRITGQDEKISRVFEYLEQFNRKST